MDLEGRCNALFFFNFLKIMSQLFPIIRCNAAEREIMILQSEKVDLEATVDVLQKKV